MSMHQADGTPDLKSWIEENHSALLRLAFFCSKDPRLAEEITQEACLKIMRAWPKKRQRDLIITSRGYVFTIVRNVFLSQMKSYSRISQSETQLGPEHDTAFTNSDTALRKLLVDLAEDERAMLILRYHFRMTTLEAGRQLGLSRDASYRLHDRALATLRAQFEDQED